MSLYSNPHVEERLKIMEAAQHFSKTGGEARAKKLSPKRRSDIASKAAKTRWEKPAS